VGCQKGKKNKKLEVHIMFEASRIASQCLSEAYERVVPMTRRALPSGREIIQVKQDETQRRAGGAGHE
jgi:hypothetical protein